MSTDLLTNIQRAYAKLGEHITLAEPLLSAPLAHILVGHHILMVDDSREALIAFVEPLMVATDGKAEFLFHSSQTGEQLCEEILSSAATLILLDGNLRYGIKGEELIASIKHARPSLRIIGFSSSMDLEAPFMKAGAEVFVQKDTSEPAQTVRELAQALAENVAP